MPDQAVKFANLLQRPLASKPVGGRQVQHLDGQPSAVTIQGTVVISGVVAYRLLQEAATATRAEKSSALQASRKDDEGELLTCRPI